jgi:thiamine pyrophosphokinase
MLGVAIVLAGGDPVGAHLRSSLPDNALVVAADSGVHLAATLGLHVDIVVGDFDSADAAIVDDAVASGATIERHPADKDATDLELALVAACREGARRIAVVGGAGGRLDHFLGNIAVLASPRFAAVQVEALLGDDHLWVARGGQPPVTFTAPAGATITLLATGGDAIGITTKGLQYPLHSEDLPAGTTRGISNVVTGDDQVSVGLRSGTLLVIQPGGAS